MTFPWLICFFPRLPFSHGFRYGYDCVSQHAQQSQTRKLPQPSEAIPWLFGKFSYSKTFPWQQFFAGFFMTVGTLGFGEAENLELAARDKAAFAKSNTGRGHIVWRPISGRALTTPADEATGKMLHFQCARHNRSTDLFTVNQPCCVQFNFTLLQFETLPL